MTNNSISPAIFRNHSPSHAYTHHPCTQAFRTQQGPPPNGTRSQSKAEGCRHSKSPATPTASFAATPAIFCTPPRPLLNPTLLCYLFGISPIRSPRRSPRTSWSCSSPTCPCRPIELPPILTPETRSHTHGRWPSTCPPHPHPYRKHRERQCDQPITLPTSTTPFGHLSRPESL